MNELNELEEQSEHIEPEQKEDSLLVRLFDIMLVNLLFVVTCIPVITIADAAASVYHVMLKKERGTCDEIVKTYFSAFLRNFLGSLPYALLLFIVVFAVCSGFMTASEMNSIPLLLLCMTLSLFAVLILGWTIPLFAQFDNSFSAMMINSVKLAVKHPVESVKMAGCHLILPLVFLIVPGIFIYVLFFWMLAGFGLTARYICRLLVPIFDRLIETEREAGHS